jgi:predicted dehydrogenase
MHASRRTRIGLLGASRIAPTAVIVPARDLPSVEIVAVAARDTGRARDFAREHGIAETCDDYAGLVARADIDLVYVGLPTHAHEEWSIAALQAGRHVLLEKPSAPVAAAARRMVAAAQASGRRLVEAFHYRYHPLMTRLLELTTSGAIGRIESIDALIDVPVPRRPGEIRWSAELAGGALMDLGCYPVHWLRTIGGEFTVADARIALADSGVDESVEARLRFDSGARGTLSCSMVPHERGRRTSLVIEGSAGAIHVRNPIAPQMGHEFRWRNTGDWIEERLPLSTSYFHQLQAVAAALGSGAPLPTEGADIIANMQAIEAIYAAGGIVRPWH